MPRLYAASRPVLYSVGAGPCRPRSPRHVEPHAEELLGAARVELGCADAGCGGGDGGRAVGCGGERRGRFAAAVDGPASAKKTERRRASKARPAGVD